MEIHELNTKAISDPAYMVLDDGSDTYKANFGAIAADVDSIDTRLTTAEGNITDLTSDLSEITSDLSEITSDLKQSYYTYTDIISGGVNGSGAVTTNSARIRTADVFAVSAGDVIYVNSGTLKYGFEIWEGSLSSGNRVRNDDCYCPVGTDRVRIIRAGYCCIVFKKSSGADITPEEFDGEIRIYSRALAEHETEITALQSFGKPVYPVHYYCDKYVSVSIGSEWTLGTSANFNCVQFEVTGGKKYKMQTIGRTSTTNYFIWIDADNIALKFEQFDVSYDGEVISGEFVAPLEATSVFASCTMNAVVSGYTIQFAKVWEIIETDEIKPTITVTNVRSINHRGWHEYPENTLIAFKQSKLRGFDYVETDVQFTSDGVPVLLHDLSINRTARNADGTELSSTVNIADITYAEAAAYDYGLYKGTQFEGTTIAKFEDFIKLCKYIGLNANVEVKSAADYTTAQLQELANIVIACGMADKVKWTSFWAPYLETIKGVIPTAPLAFADYDITASSIAKAVALKTDYNTVTYAMYYYRMTDALIEDVISAGLPLQAWTVDEEDELLALNPYISEVMSNTLNAAEVFYKNNIS